MRTDDSPSPAVGPGVAAAQRLSVVDEIFLRTHRGYGTPIALQGVWRTADRMETDLLEALRAALRVGPLGRRILPSTVPGARRRWRRTVRAHPLLLRDGVLPEREVLDWADTLADALDPEHGPGWRLAAAHLDDGGTAVSLTCSHVLADGRGLVMAADEAMRRLPGRAHLVAASPERFPTTTADSEWVDAWRQWSTVLRGTAGALRDGIPSRPTASRPRPPAPSGQPVTRAVVAQCPTGDWERAASADGGTVNSVFIALVARTLWAAGFAPDAMQASLPVDTRAEPRVDNDLSMTHTTLVRADTPAVIRDKARAAYEFRMTGPGGLPEEILQVIPDRWAAALSAGAGERDILCSNIGDIPESLLEFGPHHCTGLATRAIHPGLRPDRCPRTRLSGYLCRSGPDQVLSLVALDPELVPSARALREAASEAAESLSLPLRFW